MTAPPGKANGRSKRCLRSWRARDAERGIRDREQHFRDNGANTIEEAYDVAGAIERGNKAAT